MTLSNNSPKRHENYYSLHYNSVLCYENIFLCNEVTSEKQVYSYVKYLFVKGVKSKLILKWLDSVLGKFSSTCIYIKIALSIHRLFYVCRQTVRSGVNRWGVCAFNR